MARGRRASNAGKPRTDTRPDDVSARVGTDNWRTLGAGVAAILACGVVYLGTAARDIVVGDTPELSAAAVTLGIPHPSGYPLLMLVGHAFSALPVGPLPFRVNLTAVACSTGTVGLVFWISWRLTHSRLAALVAALTLGFSTLFWSWSLVFEAFPLNNLLAATVILLLVFWQQQPDRFRYLVGAAFVMGLGMANHQTISLLGPAILYLLWRQRQVLLQRPGVVAVCSVALCAGLLPYLYVPLAASRAPRLNWGDISSLEGVVRLFLRSDYGTGTLVQSPLYLRRRGRVAHRRARRVFWRAAGRPDPGWPGGGCPGAALVSVVCSQRFPRSGRRIRQHRQHGVGQRHCRMGARAVLPAVARGARTSRGRWRAAPRAAGEAWSTMADAFGGRGSCCGGCAGGNRGRRRVELPSDRRKR